MSIKSQADKLNLLRLPIMHRLIKEILNWLPIPLRVNQIKVKVRGYITGLQKKT